MDYSEEIIPFSFTLKFSIFLNSKFWNFACFFSESHCVLLTDCLSPL